MRVVEPESMRLDTTGLTPYQIIEMVGRTCYKSTDKIDGNSAVKFVQDLLGRQHTAMLEHAHIYYKMADWLGQNFTEALNIIDEHVCGVKVRVRNYFNISKLDKCVVVSGSFRSFIALWTNKMNQVNDRENIGYYPAHAEACASIMHLVSSTYPEIFSAIQKPSDLPIAANEITVEDLYDIADAEFAHNSAAHDEFLSRHVVHTCWFTCDRGVSHEFVRHRPCAFGQESTRYCNYAKDKFGNEITVIRPVFFEPGTEDYKTWYEGCLHDEEAYFKLINNGRIAQEARDNLPNSTKTEIWITANEEEWQHILNLRLHGTTGKPHPQMIQSVSLVADYLIKGSGGRLH